MSTLYGKEYLVINKKVPANAALAGIFISNSLNDY